MPHNTVRVENVDINLLKRQACSLAEIQQYFADGIVPPQHDKAADWGDHIEGVINLLAQLIGSAILPSLEDR